MNRPYLLVGMSLAAVLFAACNPGDGFQVVTCDGGLCEPDSGTGGDPVSDAGANPPICAAQGPDCPTSPHGIVCELYPGGPCAVLVCDPGWNDCNGQIPDGCETNVADDPQNCGACGKACSPTAEECSGGACK